MHINTYTLKQYQECYPDLLERHKLEYEDYNEFTFINKELENFYDSIFDIDELIDNHDYDEILFSRKVFPQNFFEQRDYDHSAFMDAVKKSNLSSSKIIDFLESRKQELENNDKQNFGNPYPDIFTGNDNKAYTLFKEFSENHINDMYTDYSFIFQQMKFNKYILDIKQRKFIDWLKENQYINDKDHSFFVCQNSLKALNKCAFPIRVNPYIQLKDKIFPTSSD
jgi:hypothetical protein